ncbi:hypothetical protein AK830_g9783 [Neonectria ditissima]|uniref:Uncharacterized protein n=1 Tax=Neonectria ditissima TaxID=78410 RepID=A0A0P7BBR4_9HYPO|nr:hypothetical protein AK830_g9783 [Neonectria ditissima]
MCNCLTYKYGCGHETKVGYYDCLTKRRIKREECCRFIDFGALLYPSGPCDEPWCQYVPAMRRGWKCCACGQGPNYEGEFCNQDLNARGWKFVSCRHKYCRNCDVWETREQRKARVAREKKDKDKDGGGGGSAAKGVLQKSLRLMNRVASGSSFGM